MQRPRGGGRHVLTRSGLNYSIYSIVSLFQNPVGFESENAKEFMWLKKKR
jgi:hypothetical protein